MNIGINQFCYPTSWDVANALRSAKRIGYQSFEACFTLSEAELQTVHTSDALGIGGYHNRLLNTASSDNDIHTLLRLSRDEGIPITSMGGVIPLMHYSLISADPEIRRKAMDACKKMLDAASALACPCVQIIPGLLTPDMGYREGYERAQECLVTLADYAPDRMIGVENVWNHYLYSPMEWRRFIEEMNRDNLRVYFDIGNARRFGYPQQWIYELNGLITRLHVKDYRMSVDTINGFTNLLDGDVDFPAVLRALRDTGYAGEMVVEIIPPASVLVEETLRYSQKTLSLLMQQHYNT